LQDDIDRNLKLREGAARILGMAANTIQRLDAAKTILVSNARLVVSMQQLQREKTSEATAAVTPSASNKIGVSSGKQFCIGKATLCLSGIRIPLLWKDTSLTPNASSTLNRLLDPNYQWTSANLGGGYSSLTLTRHQRPLSAVLSSMGNAIGENTGEWCSAFCIVRVGDQIRETRLLCEVRPGTSDLEFDDVLTFENVLPDFECTIEVYGYQSTDQGSMSFLRRKSRADTDSLAHRNSVFLGTLTPEYTKVSPFSSFSPPPPHPLHPLFSPALFLTSSAFDCCFTLVARYIAKIADLGSKVNAHQLELLSAQNHNTSLSHLFFSSPSASSSSNVNSSNVNTLLSTVSAYPTSENALPLFGPICFSLTAQPNSVHKPLRSGLLLIRTVNDDAETDMAKLYFCELQNQCLYARMVKPTSSLSTILPISCLNCLAFWLQSPVKCEEISLSESLSGVRLRNPKIGIPRKPQCKWDLVVKVDPSTQFLDDEPVSRELPLFLKSLTVEERDHLFLSSSKPAKQNGGEAVLPKPKPRRSMSMGGGFAIPPIAASSPVKAVVEGSGFPVYDGKENGANEGDKSNKCLKLPRNKSMNEVQQLLLSPNLPHSLVRRMPTLRMSSRLCVGDQNLSQKTDDLEAESMEREVTLEVAAFDSFFSAIEGGNEEDSVPLLDWISAIKDHIEEQVGGVSLFKGHGMESC
uniref:Anillin domain-containing protein n=1 Tax=Rodentolepis nana TaxID=102285 RepID=A0A0R3TLT4_RODNA